MARFTLPRDLYHGKGALEALKSFTGKKAMICVGGGSMKRFGFLDRAVSYLKEAGMEVELFEGIEPDPSVETVMRGAEAMLKFEPDWIIAMGGGSPIDAAKAMWIKYEYPEITFEEMCKVFGIPPLRRKAHFCAISSTSGTATEVTAFSIITDYQSPEVCSAAGEGSHAPACGGEKARPSGSRKAGIARPGNTGPRRPGLSGGEAGRAGHRSAVGGDQADVAHFFRKPNNPFFS